MNTDYSSDIEKVYNDPGVQRFLKILKGEEVEKTNYLSQEQLDTSINEAVNSNTVLKQYLVDTMFKRAQETLKSYDIEV